MFKSVPVDIEKTDGSMRFMRMRLRGLGAPVCAFLLAVTACSGSATGNFHSETPVASGTSLKSGDSTVVLGLPNVTKGQIVVSFVGALTNTDSCVLHVLSIVPVTVSDGLRFDSLINAPSGAGGDYFGWNGSASDAKALGFSTGQAVKAFDGSSYLRWGWASPPPMSSMRSR